MTNRRRRLWRAAVTFVALAALTAGGVAFNLGGLGDTFDEVSRDLGAPWYDGTRDSDGDGLPDDVETEGWHTRDDGVFVTDPDDPDSDGDGLIDGQEAGVPTSSNRSTNVYAAVSKPNDFDTDGDKIGDGDEYFLDMNPRKRDTDGDGLFDDRELDFGSDPTLDNPDDDSYSDKEEYARGSDPQAYDLTRGQAIAAFIVGATAGDFEFGARNVGRINDAQFESPEYLAGQIASGYVGIGDIRDVAVGVGNLDVVEVLVALVGLPPLVGDAAKTVTMMAKFATRGGRAERTVAAMIERLPWTEATKKQALRRIFGRSVRLPKSLEGGPKDSSVYKGVGYVGITKNLELRKSQHATAGRTFTPTQIKGASGLSRGEARAIEEACIIKGGFKAAGGSLQNQRHSINPKLAYYDDAIAWGNAFLKKSGGTCV
jgi:hypothetical protein